VQFKKYRAPKNETKKGVSVSCIQGMIRNVSDSVKPNKTLARQYRGEHHLIVFVKKSKRLATFKFG
jgi:hypothetical protein